MVRHFLWHGIEAAVLVEDGLHDYKNNICLLKKQEFILIS
jgi:hypothetical protein